KMGIERDAMPPAVLTVGHSNHPPYPHGVPPYLGLENQGFRNYADYMLTDEFREGVKKLLEVARRKRTAIMCAEGLFWQCHRRLVSDFLAANGVTVQHVMPGGELRPHELTHEICRAFAGNSCRNWGNAPLPLRHRARRPSTGRAGPPGGCQGG